ncbi:hypothetical protein MNB_SV-5-1596 [hydrothermal vent metagenome]|uniref:Uncharacterized protein n=1 Tax=hydrothermal vent metagenome TaxID=652676 RepID=A0A1W1EFN4_9ZZZZ
MQYYNDKSNDAAANVLFMFFQMFMILIVYGFVYSSVIAVKIAITKYSLTFMAYLPEFFAFIIYPVVMYKTRKMFKQNKRIRAVIWMMGWASVIIVSLYAHLSQLIAA